jgi:hypothetical protein
MMHKLWVLAVTLALLALPAFDALAGKVSGQP